MQEESWYLAKSNTSDWDLCTVPLGALVNPPLMAAVTAGMKSFFLDTRPPRSITVTCASLSEGTINLPFLKAASARESSSGPHRSRLDLSNTMLTTARNITLRPFASLSSDSASSNSADRFMITSSSVVSTTAKPTLPSNLSVLKVNTFWSPLTSASAERPASSEDLALNCCEARNCTSCTCASSTSTATIMRSQSVVVGPCRFSVSDRIAQSSIPAVALVGRRFMVTNVCAMMVLMEPQGRMSM
mmetsp:Transcript_23102/g.51779  ORF Transcript_23102/g.51779 Transcript_23102/m.51779 type:complete len:245 (+) Transcript_23102:470-1204(+)